MGDQRKSQGQRLIDRIAIQRDRHGAAERPVALSARDSVCLECLAGAAARRELSMERIRARRGGP